MQEQSDILSGMSSAIVGGSEMNAPPHSEYRPPRREGTTPAVGHMPFPGHRTQKEVREDEPQRRLRNRHKLGRICSNCPAPIWDGSKSGLCKPCLMRAKNADPEVRRRRGETHSRILRTDKDAYARKCAILAAGRATRCPEKLRAIGKQLQQRRTPELEARRIAALVASNRRRRHGRREECPSIDPATGSKRLLEALLGMLE